MTARALPVFRGWTVDARLREFRREAWVKIKDQVGNVVIDKGLEFLPFSTPAGAVMFRLYQKERN